MDTILDTPESAQRNFEYGGFWIRFLAYIIDILVLSIVQGLLGFLFLGGEELMSGNPGVTIGNFVITLGYFAGMESSANQATLGKMALNLRVVDAAGNRISFMNAVGRYLGKILSALILLIGFIMAAFDDKKQALHDKLAKTYVIRV